VVEALVASRLGVKRTLEETRTERFLEIANRGKLPIPLRYYAAHTGRWGGSDKVNLQNLPSRGANANKLKQAIKAPRGYVVIESDSAQIEARVLAWLAEQDDLVHAFATGKDVYKQMASVIYQKDESTITKEERFVGKSVILGAGYGMGAVKFKAQLHAFGTEIGAGEAENIIAAYRRRFPNIVNLWDQGGNCLEALLTMTTTRFGRDGVLPLNPILGGFVSPVGFVHAYPGLQREPALPNMHEYTYKTRAGRTKIYGGKVVENLTQHLARCIVGEQMVRISKRYRVVMTVHDSIVCIAPKEDGDKAKEFVERCMRWAPDWAIGVPLNCEVGSGASYGDC
jgi:DNA polymerase